MHHGVRGQSPHTHTSPSPRSKAPLLFSDPFLSPLQPLPLRSVSLTSFTSFTSFASLFSNALGRRVPNELMQLQPQPHRQPIRQNPFHENARLEGIRLARIRTLHVHDFDYFHRQLSDESLPTGLDHHIVLRSKQFLRERINFFLQQRFPARQFDERNRST